MCSVVLPVLGSLALFHVVHAAVNLEDCMFYCTSPLPQCLVVWHQSANDSCYFTMICVLCRTTNTWQFGTISCWLLATSRLYVLLHYVFASWRVRCLVVWHQSANDVLVSLHDLCALSYYQYLAVWHYFMLSMLLFTSRIVCSIALRLCLSAW